MFVGGVVQEEGSDYEVRDGTIHFTRSLAREGKLGFWRWLSMFLGLVGTYRPHEDGRRPVPLRRPGTGGRARSRCTRAAPSHEA